MNNNEFKQHISIADRNRWDKVVLDFASHLGSGGVDNHRLGTGTVPGFSTNDYTNAEKSKLAGIEDGALNNPHPATHPYTMITGLAAVAHTGDFSDLINIPNTCYIAEKGDVDTVTGIRFTIGGNSPSNPKNDKEVWLDTSEKLLKVYTGNAWMKFSAVWS